MRSRESLAALDALLNVPGMIDGIRDMEGQRVRVLDGGTGTMHELTIRSFVCGDHMGMHKLTGASGPTSVQDHLQMCPYCDASPSDCRDGVYSTKGTGSRA